jgi:hypothetical protein
VRQCSYSSFGISLTLTSKGRKWFAKYYNSAVSIPSPEFDRICSVAEENKVLLSVGIIEKEGGTLYCTAILIDRDGSLLSTHRKVRDIYFEFIGYLLTLLADSNSRRTTDLGSWCWRWPEGGSNSYWKSWRTDMVRAQNYKIC